jgi:hypothetical protein
VKEKVPNASLTSIQGGAAVTITDAISGMVDGLQNCPCENMCETKQGLGIPQGDTEPTTAVISDSIAEDEFGTFYTRSVNHVLNVCWMQNDAFAGNKAKDVAAGDHEAAGELATKVFVESIEMGRMAHQFPRAVFAVGANADTWAVDEMFDFYASIPRIGLAVTGHNVASGLHDHATIAQRRHSVKKVDSADNWRYAKSGEYYVETMMAAWAVCDTPSVDVLAAQTPMASAILRPTSALRAGASSVSIDMLL